MEKTLEEGIQEILERHVAEKFLNQLSDYTAPISEVVFTEKMKAIIINARTACSSVRSMSKPTSEMPYSAFMHIHAVRVATLLFHHADAQKQKLQ